MRLSVQLEIIVIFVVCIMMSACASNNTEKRVQSAVETGVVESESVDIARGEPDRVEIDDDGCRHEYYYSSIDEQPDTSGFCSVIDSKTASDWNVEIIHEAALSELLIESEKTHLPIIKVDASDNIAMKLEHYISKDPSKFGENDEGAFSCEAGEYINTNGGVGVQLVICENEENVLNSVEFISVVSPKDRKARVYLIDLPNADRIDGVEYEQSEYNVIDTKDVTINGERGLYIGIETVHGFFHEGAGSTTEGSGKFRTNYIFMGDKLRYLVEWDSVESITYKGWSEIETEELCDEKCGCQRVVYTQDINYWCKYRETVLQIDKNGISMKTDKSVSERARFEGDKMVEHRTGEWESEAY